MQSQPREIEVRAADGRLLAAAVSGPDDADLVLFHTGTPGSRDLFPGHVEEGVRRGLRHVTYSRPGYLGSDRHPGRSMADSATDSAAVADALGVERFYVAGVSGGGGPALACAALLPDRVLSAASVSALGPRRGEGLEWLAGAAQSNVEEFATLLAGEAAVVEYLATAVERFSQICDAASMYESLGGLLCEADRECIDGDFLKYQVEACQKVAGEPIWGWLDDNWAMWNEWRIDLAQIDVPVAIWQGTADRFVPPQNGEWLADHIPGARLRLLAGEGHLSLLARHYGAILDDLVAAG